MTGFQMPDRLSPAEIQRREGAWDSQPTRNIASSRSRMPISQSDRYFSATPR